jgi:flagellin-like protein
METKLNELRSDSRGVSPVIGVVLMIAVVVILAAVVGAFATGIFGNQQQSPQAAFSLDDGTVTMDSGDSIPGDQLTVEGAGASAFDNDPVTAGSVATGATDGNTDGQITVTWTSADGGQSAVLASFDVSTGTT